MTDKLRVFSYSRCSADDNCQRERYLSREWGNTGLQPTGIANWHLEHGDIVHRGLEDLARTGSIDYLKYRKEALESAMKCGWDQIAAREWAALTEGQLRGFVRGVWPNLMKEYEIIDAERWIEYERPNNLVFRARQDLLLRSRFDGHYCYVDYKNTSSIKPNWVKSWNKSIQLHSSMLALRTCCDVPVDRALVIGLYKGYRDDRYNTLRSVFANGWINREFQMTPEYSYEYQRSRGWEKFSTFDEFPDLEQWVAQMPPSVLAEQFPQTAPIPFRADIAEEWFLQKDIREGDVAYACDLLAAAEDEDQIQAVLRRYFPQNLAKCEPAWGYDCAFKNLCWIPSVQADPLASGQFKRYKPDYEVSDADSD
jgi:hypothetical protein